MAKEAHVAELNTPFQVNSSFFLLPAGVVVVEVVEGGGGVS